MWFSSWLHNRSSTKVARNRGHHRLAASRFRPRVEGLEDRTIPSNFYAATASDLIADIKAANKAGGANTIFLTAPTTSPYVFTATNNSKLGNTVLPVIAKGDNLTIQTSNGAADPGYGDTLNAAHYGRLFAVAAGGSLTLKNVTLQNGLVYGAGVAQGGAVYNLGNLDVNHALIFGNEALGNYYLPTNKSAPTGYDAAGGAIWSNGSLTVENQTLIQYNTVIGVGSGNGYGGGICIAGGTAAISNSDIGTFSGGGNWALGGYNPNTGTYAGFGPSEGLGGGIYVGAGTATFTIDFIENNSAGNYITAGFDGFYDLGYGGGIYIAPAATVYLDSYTVAYTAYNIDDYNNGSPTANIDGAYILLP